MFEKTTRAALLGSVAAFAIGGAHAQTDVQTEGDMASEACVALADRLATDAQIEADVRTDVEAVIASGDANQCQVVFTAWEDEGEISRESLELVGTEQVTERMIVQQEIEIDADVAVYQPPAEVDVDTGTPEIVWTMPRQNATINEQAPEIIIRQARPTVHVEVPQPRVTVMIPEPEVTITWPETTLDMSQLEPMIEVRIPEPVVTVNMPAPVIELTIGGAGPSELTELEDGRFAPQGATEDDLQPRITFQGHEATVSPGQEAETPEIVFNRGEPVVKYEGQDPEVTVEVVGEPEIRISTGRQGDDGDVTPRDKDSAESDDDVLSEQDTDAVDDAQSRD
ncbi:hypothetical protein HUK65_14720 [Rhodobacteraceae bacterium 2376]|uniref:Uncharacterized protein n=1 Tax=Rhabdonatronobacter sediminivivens TaxID=2743469 RepID=A0A7Z0L0I4_9RHOB|nr:hypothetical protein [Rhabdonatronobacter sediminivivens]NYS26241.1 hypothetical protein [Rhabdonatronobacter sediminivivens]